MTGRLNPFHLPHSIRVRPYLGQGGSGPIYGPDVDLTPENDQGAFVEDVRKVVVDSSGREVISGTEVTLNDEDAVREGSQVTIWAGTDRERTAPVVAVAVHVHPNWPGFAVLSLK